MKLNIVTVLCFALVLVSACSKDAANVAIPQETGTPLTGDAAWLVGSWKVTAGWEGTVDSVYAGFFSETKGLKDTLVNGRLMQVFKWYGYGTTPINEGLLAAQKLPANELIYLGADTGYIKNYHMIFDAKGNFTMMREVDGINMFWTWSSTGWSVASGYPKTYSRKDTTVGYCKYDPVLNTMSLIGSGGFIQKITNNVFLQIINNIFYYPGSINSPWDDKWIIQYERM